MQDIRSNAVTIDDYSSLFTTLRDCSPQFAPFETIRTIRDYPLSAIRDHSPFAIRVFQTPPEAVLRTQAQSVCCWEIFSFVLDLLPAVWVAVHLESFS